MAYTNVIVSWHYGHTLDTLSSAIYLQITTSILERNFGMKKYF